MGFTARRAGGAGRSALAVALGLVAMTLALTERAGAQAWVPFRGEGTASFSFQRVDAQGHFLEDGSKLPGYRTRANNLIFNLSYSVTDQLAFNVTVPFVNVQYRGPEEPFNLPQNTLDDGTYNGAISDLGFQLRYAVIEEPFVLTPFFSAGIPSHEYETLGESAPGRGFQEYRVGAFVGKVLDPVLPRMFVHGFYSYSFVRQDIDIPLNYSSFGFEAGYVFNPSLTASFLLRQQRAHGGLSFNELFESPPEIFVNLDRVVRASFTHVGAAVNYSFTESFSGYANYLRFVDGIDAHYGDAVAVGVSWTFTTEEPPILFPEGPCP